MLPSGPGIRRTSAGNGSVRIATATSAGLNVSVRWALPELSPLAEPQPVTTRRATAAANVATTTPFR